MKQRQPTLKITPETNTDWALVGGVVRTQDPENPLAQAVAIKDDRIVAVGDNDTVLGLCSRTTRRVELNGSLVLPGFMDSHFHFFETCFFRLGLDLSATASLEQLQEAVSSRSRSLPTGSWIWGNGWFEPAWPEPKLPGRRDLDAVAPDNPVLLWRADLHMAVANSKALAEAGIGRDTPDPGSGVIDRDPEGNPTGILRDLAINMVKRAIPKPDYRQLEAALCSLTADLHACGITAVHDVHLMGGLDAPAALSFLQAANRKGLVRLRCWTSLAGELLHHAIALGLSTGFGDRRLMIGHIKYFGDGSMGARTAWQLEPYRDGGRGITLVDPQQLGEDIRAAHKAGLAVMVHAIGDRTCKMVINIMAALPGDSVVSGPAVVHRIEHLQMVRKSDLQRLAGLDVVASVQPVNLPDDIDMLEKALGPLAGRCYVFKEMAAAGIKLVFGSDHPVCPFDPLLGLSAAVTRCRPDGYPEGGWYPEQCLSVEQSLAAYTRVAADAAGAGQWLGTVTAGKKADLIVVDRDLAAAGCRISDARVLMTFFDGELVFQGE